MRVMKFALAVGLILAVSGTAGAITVPPLVGPFTAFNSSNAEIGSSYTATVDGTYDYVGGAWVGPGVVTVTTPPQVVPPEEGYGVMWIKTLYTGTPGNNIITPDVDYWHEPLGAVAGTRLMGYFWGGQDIQLDFSTVAGVQTFKSYQNNSAGFRLFAVDLTAADLGAQKVAKQLNVADSHQGNPPDPTKDFILAGVGNNWPGNTVDDLLLLEGTVQSVVFTQSGLSGTQALGKATIFMSVDPTKGVWGSTVNQDWFVSEFGDAADIRIDWVIEGPFDYGAGDKGAGYIRSNDEGGLAVPEPVTMLSIFLGVGGLGGYIRRRMAA